jgi:hypothetical protein
MSEVSAGWASAKYRHRTRMKNKVAFFTIVDLRQNNKNI